MSLVGRAIGVGVAVLAACAERPLPYDRGVATGTGGSTAPGTPPDREKAVYIREPLHQLDLLFLVDTSVGMGDAQQALVAQVPVFFNILKMLPAGGGGPPGLPDLHVGVITSNTGAGGFDLPADGCPLGGDHGQLQIQPGLDCPLGGTPFTTDGRRFLAASADQHDANYPGDISDATTCLIPIGRAGCPFSSPLEAVRWALDPLNPVPGNQGFLRPGAFLDVVILTNQDDCSLPDGSLLLDPSQVSVTDPLGPFSTFRCNEYGHLCLDGDRLIAPTRTMARNFDTCTSNDDPGHRLTRVADEVAFLRALKTDPSRIQVAAISGPALPYQIALQPRIARPGVSENQPVVLPSCGTGTTVAAQPAVRLRQWVESFGTSSGVFQSICANSFAPALMGIATTLSTLEQPMCVGGVSEDRLRDANPATPALDLDCLVSEGQVPADGAPSLDTPIAACASNGDQTPCWRQVDDSACLSGVALSVQRSTPLSTERAVGYDCAICPPGVALSGCP